MLLQLDQTADTADSLRRLILDALDDILRAAAKPDDDRARHIRLDVKRIRSYLRLLRDALGEKRFKKENRLFRDFSRPFGQLRNHEVLESTLNLLESCLKPADNLQLRALFSNKITRPDPTDFGFVMISVTAAQQRFAVPLEAPVRLPSRLKQLYRNGRRLFKLTRRQPETDNLHEWRKEAKYLRYALATVEEAGPDDATWRKRLKKLTKIIGKHHDLSLLHDLLQDMPDAPPEALPAIATLQQTLTDQALDLGARLYDRKPRAFITSLNGTYRQHSA